MGAQLSSACSTRLQRLRGFVDQVSQLLLQLFIGFLLFILFLFFFLIEELLDAVLESDDDEDEDDEVSWWLLMPHGELVPNDSESRPYLEKSLRKRGF